MLLYNFKIDYSIVGEWNLREQKGINALMLNKENVFDDVIQNDPSVKSFIEQIEKELAVQLNQSIKLIDLRRMSIDRHTTARHNIRTIPQQRVFIKDLLNQTIPYEYTYAGTLATITKSLATLDADPTLTKLKRFE